MALATVVGVLVKLATRIAVTNTATATLAQRRMASSPEIINGRAADVVKLKAKGLGLRAIARELRMAPSSVHNALQLAA